jgi:hypothetical protein
MNDVHGIAHRMSPDVLEELRWDLCQRTVLFLTTGGDPRAARACVHLAYLSVSWRRGPRTYPMLCLSGRPLRPPVCEFRFMLRWKHSLVSNTGGRF